jgi:FMN phosphatase YigB (HAD superfamily)
MTLALLLDLDDTLLDSNMSAFIPAYFQALSAFLADRISPNAMLPALISGTTKMMENQDPNRTLQEVFDAEFFPRLGVARQKLQGAIDQFYDRVFPTLQSLTRLRPGAVPLVEWALQQGYHLAIATNPLFPQKAIDHRLRWAGLPREKYPFEVVSSYEKFHFTKATPAYFAEVLAYMGWPDTSVAMVGDDAERDISPARQLGLPAYWIAEAETVFPDGLQPTASGLLEEVRPWLEGVDPQELQPSFKSPQALAAVLLSTPAALRGILSTVSRSTWTQRPEPGEWCLTEIACHLRDLEQEVNLPRLRLVLEESEPFIPGRVTDPWAEERQYIKQDGYAALTHFAAARMQTLEMLNSLKTAQWERKARHAIFGPTSLLELVSFMAEHDRLHIQQVWKTLRQLSI